MSYFSIKGYKAFNNNKRFELAPINLLIGKNGSGKSNLINSILLFREAFSKRIEGSELEEFYEKRSNSEINLGKHQLNSIIKNPFSADGLFTDSATNKHCKGKPFEFTFPLPLSYFKDRFTLNLKYEVNLSDNELKGTAILSEINICSTDQNINLFNLSKLNDRSQRSNIKINTNYVIGFLKDLEIKFKDRDPRDDGSWDMQGKYANDHDWYKEETGPNGLYKRLSTPFKMVNEVNLQTKYFGKQIEDDDQEGLLKLFRKYKVIKSSDVKNSYPPNSEELSQNVKLFLKELNEQGRDVFGNPADVFNNLTGCEVSNVEGSFIDKFYLPWATSNPNGFENSVHNFTPDLELKLVLYELLLRNIGNSVSRIYNHLNEFNYIPPSRNNFYRSSNQISNNEITNKIRNQLFDIINKDKWRKPYLNFFNDWIRELELPSDYKLANLRTLIDILNAKNNTLSDSGYGINQLIPLLASISFFNEKFDYTSFDRQTEGYSESGKDTMSYTKDSSSLFLIEEPEANLHPNYQSKLADIFIDSSWKFGHNFIIETHSEYMVRKFQYWVAKGKIKPSDVNIYYFDNKNEDPEIKDLVIKAIRINKDGSLSEPFGEGFYDEATNWQFELLKIKSIQNN